MRAFLLSANLAGLTVGLRKGWITFLIVLYLRSMNFKCCCNLFLDLCEYTVAWISGQAMIRAGELDLCILE